VLVGGGLGRTPMIGKVIRDWLPEADLLPYVEAIVSVYNLLGRRDNKYKARIKITVHEHGIEEISRLVEDRFALLRPAFGGADRALLDRIRAMFAAPEWVDLPVPAMPADPGFRAWLDVNVADHRNPDYAVVTVSLKKHGATPGDATADQMRTLADLAERYGHDELRISHEQNVVLPHVHRAHLPAIHAALKAADLATANVGLASDIIACPGMDYCALATARSIPVAQGIAERVEELAIERDVGKLQIKISGCINACGHHHVGEIGILGLDRAGVENYQITLGGSAGPDAAIGERAGPGFAYDEIVPAIERLMTAYLDLREHPGERFADAYRRLGPAPFKAALYPEARRDAA
ncbi:MAG: nitrite/sulfite reductase, partial [Hasllibacter sp.]